MRYRRFRCEALILPVDLSPSISLSDRAIVTTCFDSEIEDG
jgi:hypothetical protein